MKTEQRRMKCICFKKASTCWISISMQIRLTFGKEGGKSFRIVVVSQHMSCHVCSRILPTAFAFNWLFWSKSYFLFDDYHTKKSAWFRQCVVRYGTFMTPLLDYQGCNSIKNLWLQKIWDRKIFLISLSCVHIINKRMREEWAHWTGKKV